uniref:CSON003452 protein n=1 Tax=Culicoides sonorensis TaxID=179676 RepID=A0A336MZB8_CULSO
MTTEKKAYDLLKIEANSDDSDEDMGCRDVKREIFVEDRKGSLPSEPRRWYKHEYKIRGRKNYQNQNSNNRQQENRPHSNRNYPNKVNIKKENSGSGVDLRSRVIGRNRRDAELTKDYMAKLSNLYFPKPEGIEKTHTFNFNSVIVFLTGTKQSKSAVKIQAFASFVVHNFEDTPFIADT